MCGILFANLSCVPKPHDEYLVNLAQMADKVRHRGPDGTRELYQTKEQLYFCFHRLAIINTSETGMQPFQRNNDKVSSTLVATGEIYNANTLCKKYEFPQLRSDMEVIQLLLTDPYHKQSVVSICNELDGDFAFVCTINSKVIAARDPVGVRPLFYGTKHGSVIAFASEAKALVKSMLVDEVHPFPPGHVWVSDAFHMYTDIYDPYETMNDSKEELQRVIEHAVVKRIEHSDRPVAFLCSGGVDSSIVAAVAEKMFPDRELTAFSVSFDGSSVDTVFAEQFLSLTRIKHVPVTITEKQVEECLEEVVRVCETHDAFTVRAAVPMYLLAKYIAETTDYKVILSGEGADEIFMGYSYFNRANAIQAAKETNRLVKQLYSFDLLRADRCFAAHGLEIRVAFLDRFVIRHVLSMPGAVRQPSQGTEKGVLRKAFEEYETLDKSGVLQRRKEGLSNGVGYNLVPYIVKFISRCIKASKTRVTEAATTEEVVPLLELTEMIDTVSFSPEEKLQNEADWYKAVFDKFYERHRDLILPRTMPEWSKNKPNPIATCRVPGKSAVRFFV